MQSNFELFNTAENYITLEEIAACYSSSRITGRPNECMIQANMIRVLADDFYLINMILVFFRGKYSE